MTSTVWKLGLGAAIVPNLATTTTRVRDLREIRESEIKVSEREGEKIF